MDDGQMDRWIVGQIDDVAGLRGSDELHTGDVILMG